MDKSERALRNIDNSDVSIAFLTASLAMTLLWAPLSLAAAAKETASPAPGKRIHADVAWLADDAREGRGLGTAGLVASEDWLAKRYAEIGLLPAGENGGYFQSFEVTIGVASGAGTALALDGQAVAAGEFVIAPFSAPGKVQGEVVAAGYGISATDLEHDDYKDLDVKGKVVVVRRFVPPGARFSGEEKERRFGDLRYKAFNAREHGAAALLIVDWPDLMTGETMPEEAKLPSLRVDHKGDAGLPVLVLKRSVGTALFQGAHKAELAADVVLEKSTTRNVVGKVAAGAPAKREQPLVIGAHFDHLGLGSSSSLTPDDHAPHNGADDNASGTAAMLEIARLLQARRAELERDVYIAAFSGEESGLLGSAAYVRAPTAGALTAQFLAMINLDMVGRLRDDKLQILGAASAQEWNGLLEPLCAKAKFTCQMGGDGYGPSDQMSFYAAGVPVLHFFTGTHEDYHKVSDDTDKINNEGTARIAALIADLSLELGRKPEKLSYVQAAAPPTGGDARSFGAGLGTIPDYADDKPGVRITSARPGSAADKAGVLPGDRMIELGGAEIRNIYDFVYVLRTAKPGDKVKLVVLRGDQRLELDVVYDESRRRP
jgi:hypothetical protein